MFDSGRQHVQGHRKGGEPCDQGPEEQADHQEESAPQGTACARFTVPVAGDRTLPAIKLCLRLLKLLLQARPLLLLPFGPPLHLHALLARPLEIFGQPLALLTQTFRFLLDPRRLRLLSLQPLGPTQDLLVPPTLLAPAPLSPAGAPAPGALVLPPGARLAAELQGAALVPSRGLPLVAGAPAPTALHLPELSIAPRARIPAVRPAAAPPNAP